ncbi:MAG: hypothetical protein IT374_24745 [Polyangiaceae bacterium]|nr:hypothetical protein [Polyangiaceae bacterium]
MGAPASLLLTACALTAGCDGRARAVAPARTAEPAPRVLVFTREPTDGRAYEVVSELAASSGGVRRARDRLVREAEKHRCTAVQITEEWSEEVPDAPGDRRFFARGKCLVVR